MLGQTAWVVSTPKIHWNVAAIKSFQGSMSIIDLLPTKNTQAGWSTTGSGGTGFQWCGGRVCFLDIDEALFN